MQISELVRTYKAVQTHFPVQFLNAEVYAEHDELYIHLEKPSVFSDKEIEFLDELGLNVHDSTGSENQVLSFYIYL